MNAFMIQLNLKTSIRMLCLIAPISAVALTVMDAVSETGLQRMERAYRKEQAQIDLALAGIQLEASRGQITSEEAQLKTHEWLVANEDRLKAQQALASELDRFSPLSPPQPAGSAGPNSIMSGTVEGVRFEALEKSEQLAMAQLRSKASSGEEMQKLVDDWAVSAEGSAILEEKRKLWQQAASRNPLSTIQAFVPALGENATQTEKEIHELESGMADRLHKILADNPGASPEDVQAMIDSRKEETDEEAVIMRKLLRKDYDEKLEAEVVQLQAEVDSQTSLGEADAPGGK